MLRFLQLLAAFIPKIEFQDFVPNMLNATASTNQMAMSAHAHAGQPLVQSALFFSTQGPCSLATAMATGDFDGDRYLAILHGSIVQAVAEARDAAAASAAAEAVAAEAAARGLGWGSHQRSGSQGLQQRQGQGQQRVSSSASYGSSGGSGGGSSKSSSPGSWPVSSSSSWAPASAAAGAADGATPAGPLEALEVALRAQQVVAEAHGLWEAWADAHGPGDARCLSLSRIYSQVKGVGEGPVPRLHMCLAQPL